MSKTSKLKILITGVGGPAGINISKLLQAYPEHEVLGCDIDSLSAGRFFVHEFFIAPRVTDKDVYVKWLKEMIDTKGVDVLIPTVHEELPIVAALVAELPCYVVISSEAAVAYGDDKADLYTWAESHILAHAIPWILLSDWSPEWLADDAQFVKPRRGRGGRGCQKLTKKELVSFKENSDIPEEYIVMQFMSGTEWTVDAYQGRVGEMVYVVPRERIGLAGGIAIKGKTVRHQVLIDLSTKVCKTIGFYGPVCLQWRADASGTPRLIEINPRLSGGLPITVAAGVNPVPAILAEATGQVASVQSWEEVTVIGHFEYKTL